MENLTKTQINTFLGGFLAHLKRKHELLLLFTVIWIRRTTVWRDARLSE